MFCVVNSVPSELWRELQQALLSVRQGVHFLLQSGVQGGQAVGAA
jgi:hypothetical protein